MPNPVYADRDVESIGFLLTTVSPSARKMIDMETWRTFVSSDEGDADHILPLLFQCLTTDLETIGITCAIDYDSISSDPTSFFAFLNLSRLFLPNTLYPMAQDRAVIRDALRSISDGSFSTGQTAITTWIDMIAGHEGMPPLIDGFGPVAELVRSSITSDQRFMDYLLAMEANLQLSRLTPRIDPQETERYTEILKAGLWRQHAIQSKLTALLSEEEFFAVSAKVKRFTRDLLNPDDLVNNQYLFLNTAETLPQDLRFSYQQRWYHFRVSYPLYLDYYTARQIALEPVHYALILSGLPVIHKTNAAYQEALVELLAACPEMNAWLGEVDVKDGVYE